VPFPISYALIVRLVSNSLTTFVGRSNPDKNQIPLMMFARSVSVPRKRPVEHFELADIANVEPTPSGKGATALPADLPREQSRNAFLNAVVVRFNDPYFVLIPEPNQPPILDRTVKWPVQSKIDYDFIHLSVLPLTRRNQQGVHHLRFYPPRNEDLRHTNHREGTS
jgi:hypothetical protein